MAFVSCAFLFVIIPYGVWPLTYSIWRKMRFVFCFCMLFRSLTFYVSLTAPGPSASCGARYQSGICSLNRCRCSDRRFYEGACFYDHFESKLSYLWYRRATQIINIVVTNKYIHIYSNINNWIQLYLYSYIYSHMCIYIYIYTYICVYVYIHMYIHVYIYMYMYIYMCVCVNLHPAVDILKTDCGSVYMYDIYDIQYIIYII